MSNSALYIVGLIPFAVFLLLENSKKISKGEVGQRPLLQDFESEEEYLSLRLVSRRATAKC